ncbi:MAG: hypothetical protein ACOY4O_06585 [Pseudomonadota bacterium]|jgi:hypothetical protein
MRRLLIAAAAIATVAGAAVMASPRAEAMTLPGVVAGGDAVEKVQLVCRRVWNGYRWVRSCYRAAPRYYGGGYYAPRPRYYAPRYYAPRYY